MSEAIAGLTRVVVDPSTGRRRRSGASAPSLIPRGGAGRARWRRGAPRAAVTPPRASHAALDLPGGRARAPAARGVPARPAAPDPRSRP
jgi:hypothetical protein